MTIREIETAAERLVSDWLLGSFQEGERKAIFQGARAALRKKIICLATQARAEATSLGAKKVSAPKKK